MGRLRRGVRYLFLFAFVVVFIGGCSEGEPGGVAPAEAEVASSSVYARAFSVGPVTMRISVDATEVGLADQVVLEQVIEAEPGFVVDLPTYGSEEFESIEHFTVVDLDRIEEETSETGLRTFGRQFTLEAMRSGRLTIPPLYAYFHREGQRSETELVSEPVEIDVAPIEDVDTLALKPPKEIVRRTLERRPLWPWVVGGGVGLAMLAGFVIWLVKRDRAVAPARAIPPHEWAYEEMRQLVAAGWVEKGEFERFYVGLSSILREYIERRLDIHAPDRTTEEFLEEAAGHEALVGHQDRLREFLTFADMVKFATYQPVESDVQRSFDSLKLFVEETKIVGT